MRTACDDVLNLRLPAAMRASLDGAAAASGAKVSAVARRAIEAGLAAVRPAADPDQPPTPPAPLAPAMKAAA